MGEILQPAPLSWGFCGHLLTDSRYSVTLVGPQLEVVENLKGWGTCRRPRGRIGFQAHSDCWLNADPCGFRTAASIL